MQLKASNHVRLIQGLLSVVQLLLKESLLLTEKLLKQFETIVWLILKYPEFKYYPAYKKHC